MGPIAIGFGIVLTILGIFLYRTLSAKQFYKVTLDTIETTAGVLLIVAAASLFGWVLTTTRVTEYVCRTFQSGSFSDVIGPVL